MRLRFRKDDPEHNLLAAAQHYIIANGGTAVIIGGFQVQRWPENGAFRYRLAVKVAGRPPTVAASGEQQQSRSIPVRLSSHPGGKANGPSEVRREG